MPVATQLAVPDTVVAIPVPHSIEDELLYMNLLDSDEQAFLLRTQTSLGARTQQGLSAPHSARSDGVGEDGGTALSESADSLVVAQAVAVIAPSPLRGPSISGSSFRVLRSEPEPEDGNRRTSRTSDDQLSRSSYSDSSNTNSSRWELESDSSSPRSRSRSPRSYHGVVGSSPAVHSGTGVGGGVGGASMAARLAKQQKNSVPNTALGT